MLAYEILTGIWSDKYKLEVNNYPAHLIHIKHLTMGTYP